MKSTVYIESSVISYLTARPSNDLIKSARQAITEEWWQKEKLNYDVYVSALVEEEISHGHPEASFRRLEIVKKMLYTLV